MIGLLKSPKHTSIAVSLAGVILLSCLSGPGCRFPRPQPERNVGPTLLHPWSMPELAVSTTNGMVSIATTGVSTFAGLHWAIELYSRDWRGVTNAQYNLYYQPPDGRAFVLDVDFEGGTSIWDRVSLVASHSQLYPSRNYLFVDISGNSSSGHVPPRSHPWDTHDWRWLVGEQTGTLTIQEEEIEDQMHVLLFDTALGGVVSEFQVTNGMRSSCMQCEDREGHRWVVDMLEQARWIVTPPR